MDAQAKGPVPAPPRGLAVLTVLGPGLIWAGEYIGSGEVILATRTGAVLGLAVLWVPVFAIFTKYWIGVSGAWYTTCTGEGMVDMMSRTPGPRHWVVWLVFVGQVAASATSTGAIAGLAGVFAASLIPLPPFLLGWIIALVVIALTWSGKFDVLKKAMSMLVLVIIVGVCDVAMKTWPSWRDILGGLFFFQVPEPAVWAQVQTQSAWAEILPLLGWAAGGFASQVWYSYWVLGAGYGMARGRNYGEPLDAVRLRNLTEEEATNVRGWCRVMSTDATMAVVIGICVTAAFMIAGAGVLGPKELAPQGPSVAIEVSQIFSDNWGAIGAKLFLLAGLAAMVSTLMGQFAGWPRLLADCSRILIPAVRKYSWRAQFRFILVCFAVSNLVLVYTFGKEPVFLVKLSAILDGLLLTPIQALAVGLTLFLVMPRLYSAAVAKQLRPPAYFAVGLVIAGLLFTYFCIFRMPEVIGK